MCGRYTLRTPASKLAEVFELLHAPDISPRYNIAPTQRVLTIRAAENRVREPSLPHWGLIPSWAQDPSIGSRMINARSDTAATKPAFRSAFRQRRCLIPADGFYEWQAEGRIKQPYFIHRRDDEPFAFAGLWESWHRDGQEPIESCTILTTDANPTLSQLHDRMPVILPEEEYDRWLDPQLREPSLIQPLLAPWAGDDLMLTPVSTLVNSPRNDSPACLEPPSGSRGTLFDNE